MFVSVTRLKLRGFRFLLPFFFHNERSVKQLHGAVGFLGGRTLMDSGLTFWTLTGWSSEAAMKCYRDKGAHYRAMFKLKYWCCEAAVSQWEQESTELPDWNAAYEKLVADPHFSSMKKPNEAQRLRRIAAPRWRTSRKHRGSGILD